MAGMDGKAYQAELAAAAHWLHQQTLAHAAAWGLGEERRFGADQDRGALTLHFDVGADVVLPMQILASFDPHDRTFRWAWANRSAQSALSRAAETARAWGEANRVADFTAPVRAQTFDALSRMVALAAAKAGCAGVYRGITDDSLSVFMGFAAPEDGAYWPNGRVDEAFLEAARALITGWHQENFALDAAHERDPHRMDELLVANDTIYDRTWRRADAYWRPCSFSWPSDHDPAKHIEVLTLPRRAGGAFVITRRDLQCDAHVVEQTDAGLRITDQDLDWGNGLIWPTTR
jgi:hypothetical protein